MTRVSAPTGKLSALETAVLRYAAEGHTIEATASLLNSSTPAAQDARHRLMGKLGARSMPHAVLLACRAGLLDGRPQRHGDHAGFTAHIRRGEPPCDACADGELDYRAGRRQARHNNQQQEAA